MTDATPRTGSLDTWIFDLDDTLYPASTNLFTQVVERMALFIADHLMLPIEEAHAVRRDLARNHGTTLRGLMTRHGIRPGGFLDFVHDIDLTALAPMPELDRALAALPGRKIVYTNGSVAHAERVLARIGIGAHFEAVFDIEAAAWTPKPEPGPYRALLARHAIVPTRAVMLEDRACNLVPAHALGMTTVWVRPPPPWRREDPAARPGAPHIHHVTDDLVAWLRAAAESSHPAAGGVSVAATSPFHSV